MPGARRAAILAAVAALVVSASAGGQIVTPEGQVRATPFGQEPKRISPPPRRPGIVSIDNASIDRLEQWLGAVAGHEPGAFDQAFEAVESWSPDELRTLWVNVSALLKLIREPAWKKVVYVLTGVRQQPKPLSFTVTHDGGATREIRYTLLQTQRLKVMACAVDGDTLCPEIIATGGFGPVLDRVADRARDAKHHGDQNFVLKHGAMLHADIAIAAKEGVGPHATGGVRTTGSPAPQQMVIDLFDGSAIGSREVGIHWTLARLLLDEVIPAGAKNPAPGGDDLVRAWYRATAAWMQHVQDHDTQHLDRARELFPDDPDILFLSGSQRETFAAGRVQSAVHGAALPPGLSIDVGSDQKETKRAEEYYRRAIAARPDFAEARLHLGHVLLVRGGYGESAAQLSKALGGLTDPLLQYYDAILLGAADTQLGRYDEARAAYESAAAMQPTAQAPLFGLADMDRRRGDRLKSLAALQRVFALAPAEPDRDDPWWRYNTSQVRDADDLIDSLRGSFRSTDGATIPRQAKPREP